MSENTAFDREGAIEWGKNQLTKSIDELVEMGIVSGPAVEGRLSWMLPFRYVIGELRESASDEIAIWVIGGDAPTDHLDARLADTPRAAARHFSLKWQVDAERSDNAGALIEQAEFLYALAETDDAWKDL